MDGGCVSHVPCRDARGHSPHLHLHEHRLESLERFNGTFLSGHRLARHRIWDQDLGEHRQEFV